MIPSYSPSIAVPDKFIETRRKMLLNLAILKQGSGPVPMYLINEDKDYITFDGDRILIKPYEQP